MRVLRRPIHAGFVMVALDAMFIAGCGHHGARVKAPVAPARIGSTETGVASWYGVPYDGRRAASGEVYDMRQLTAAHRSLPFQTWVEVTNLANGKQVEVRINDRGPFVKGRIVDLSQAAARDIDMIRSGTARVRLKVIPPPDILPRLPSSVPPSEPPSEPVKIPAAPVVVLPPPTIPVNEPPLSDPAPTVTAPPVEPTTPDAAPAVTVPATTAPRAPGYAVQAGAFSDPARAESLRATLAGLFTETHIVSSNGRTPPLWRVIVGRGMTREEAAEFAIRVRRESGTAMVVLEPTPNN